MYERIQNLVNLQYAISKGEDAAVQELKELYLLALNKTMKRECYSCRIRAYTELINLTNQQIETMSKPKKYTLKDEYKDEVFQVGYDHFVSSTLTDEVAEQMIKNNKENAKYFDVADDSKAKKDTTKAE